MDRIDFDTKADENGLIRIPDEYVKGLAKKETIHVTITTSRPERKTVKRMRENPFHVPDFKPLTRDEIYDRSK